MAHAIQTYLTFFDCIWVFDFLYLGPKIIQIIFFISNAQTKFSAQSGSKIWRNLHKVSVAFSPYKIKMIFEIISSDYNKLGAGIVPHSKSGVVPRSSLLGAGQLGF